jgi:hypothetical protein
VIAGAEDVATTSADVAFIAGQIPGATCASSQRTAHLANVEQADAFTAARVEHLHD